ncbi:type II toxin-antitoxin system VapC family toxin [Streptomyces sp. NPDC127098]|uniref:type II toxin-antitoxin system VapC family toxin n=1 Tax=Streptomyces sp. NPDC127098 TaxID=3347137 RepID=UPI003647590D
MIVIDCSALVHGLTDTGERGDAVRARIAAHELAAPALLDFEVASALFGMARGRRGDVPKLAAKNLDEALATYQALAIRRYDALPFWPRVRELSANLSAYDAAYVALAEALNVVLVTSDRRIEKSGVARATVDVL